MLDSRQKRAAIIGTARAWYRNPHPSSMNAAERAAVGQTYPVALFSQPAPIFTGTVNDISVIYASGTYMYDFTTYYTYAMNYAISPDLKPGWSFVLGVLTIDTDGLGNFGPFTVSGINSTGQADSNDFTIQVAVTLPIPGGISRTTTATGQNRSLKARSDNRIAIPESTNRELTSKGANRTITFTNKNRS